MNNSHPPISGAPAPSAANITEPVRIAHYELGQCIGRGGMGLVFRARDTRLDRQVAIKCLRTELFEHHYVERFKREALLLAKLNHPNIVQIYDFIDTTDQLALVMELVDGQNLQTYLREHIVSIAQRLQWLVQITEGLAVAHDAGIIHRDLKTENILINQRGQAKITDLGIAKSQDFKGTLTDHVAGSYCSMSPEQAMGETITFKSDLFSLGILAYQLLCGAHPFGDTSNKLQTMQRIISHPPTAPQKYNPDLPAEFIDLLGQLLSKDPDKRPDNTHWVAAQFEKLKSLSWQENASSDDTQALAAPLPSSNTKASRTQDHPTFDTRFVAMPITPKVSAWQKLKNYIAANKIAVGSAAISLLIIAGVIVWQLQPKPPKYVAVIPPKLTAEGMQESQQELVKGAVYDAIQQSVIQLDGYYLIPREEIADVNGDNETIHKATAADELVTADIQCELEACTIKLSRLTPDHKNTGARLRVENTKTVDILTSSYIASADIIQNSISIIYSQKMSSQLTDTTEEEYATFLEVNRLYSQKGADEKLLVTLNEVLQKNKKSLPAIQTLFSDISLDLYHDTKNPEHLKKLGILLGETTQENENITHLNNLFYLNVAEENFSAAESIAEKIMFSTNSSFIHNELRGYLMMAKQDYAKATEYYEKALTHRKTSNIYYYISLANWHYGNNDAATKYLQNALTLSPTSIKAYNLQGIIYLVEGNIEEAKFAFNQIITQKPNDPLNLSNLGICHLLLHNYEKAHEFFSSASQLAPHNALFELNKADAKNLSGKNDEAKTIYLRLIERLREGSPTVDDQRYLAQSYAHAGLFSEALTTLKDLERKDENNIETIYTAALVHTLANNHESALLYVKSALHNGMNHIWFSFSWFDALCTNNNFTVLMNEKGAPNRCSF